MRQRKSAGRPLLPTAPVPSRPFRVIRAGRSAAEHAAPGPARRTRRRGVADNVVHDLAARLELDTANPAVLRKLRLGKFRVHVVIEILNVIGNEKRFRKIDDQIRLPKVPARL